MGLEITAVNQQTVASQANILFTETPVSSGKCLIHREGSGVVTARGLTNQCFARFKVTFGGNVAIPTGGTVGAITLAISLNGEGLPSTEMVSTPSAVAEFNNVSRSAYFVVPQGCCVQVSVKNLTDTGIVVENANLIVERVA